MARPARKLKVIDGSKSRTTRKKTKKKFPLKRVTSKSHAKAKRVRKKKSKKWPWLVAILSIFSGLFFFANRTRKKLPKGDK